MIPMSSYPRDQPSRVGASLLSSKNAHTSNSFASVSNINRFSLEKGDGLRGQPLENQIGEGTVGGSLRRGFQATSLTSLGGKGNYKPSLSPRPVSNYRNILASPFNDKRLSSILKAETKASLGISEPRIFELPALEDTTPMRSSWTISRSGETAKTQQFSEIFAGKTTFTLREKDYLRPRESGYSVSRPLPQVEEFGFKSSALSNQSLNGRQKTFSATSLARPPDCNLQSTKLQLSSSSLFQNSHSEPSGYYLGRSPSSEPETKSQRTSQRYSLGPANNPNYLRPITLYGFPAPLSTPALAPLPTSISTSSPSPQTAPPTSLSTLVPTSAFTLTFTEGSFRNLSEYEPPTPKLSFKASEHYPPPFLPQKNQTFLLPQFQKVDFFSGHQGTFESQVIEINRGLEASSLKFEHDSSKEKELTSGSFQHSKLNHESESSIAVNQGVSQLSFRTVQTPTDQNTSNFQILLQKEVSDRQVSSRKELIPSESPSTFTETSFVFESKQPGEKINGREQTGNEYRFDEIRQSDERENAFEINQINPIYPINHTERYDQRNHSNQIKQDDNEYEDFEQSQVRFSEVSPLQFASRRVPSCQNSDFQKEEKPEALTEFEPFHYERETASPAVDPTPSIETTLTPSQRGIVNFRRDFSPETPRQNIAESINFQVTFAKEGTRSSRGSQSLTGLLTVSGSNRSEPYSLTSERTSEISRPRSSRASQRPQRPSIRDPLLPRSFSKKQVAFTGEQDEVSTPRYLESHKRETRQVISRPPSSSNLPPGFVVREYVPGASLLSSSASQPSLSSFK